MQSTSTESNVIYPVFKEEESLDDSMNNRTLCGRKHKYLNVYDCQFKRPRRMPLVSNWCELSNGMSSREILNKPCPTNSEDSQSNFSLVDDSRPPESLESIKTGDR